MVDYALQPNTRNALQRRHQFVQATLIFLPCPVADLRMLQRHAGRLLDGHELSRVAVILDIGKRPHDVDQRIAACELREKLRRRSAPMPKPSTSDER